MRFCIQSKYFLMYSDYIITSPGRRLFYIFMDVPLLFHAQDVKNFFKEFGSIESIRFRSAVSMHGHKMFFYEKCH